MSNPVGKVLIVDDELVNIKVLVATLDDHETIVAKNGQQAIEKATASLPDLILLDVNMPDMDGYEVCTQLKANPTTKDIPVIFITINSSVDEETKGLEMGAVDYIAKPFSPGIVKARVANHIQLKQHRDLLARLNLTDALTGIANRRRFDDHLTYEWQEASRAGSSLSLILIDIDHFKQINDLKGHAYGDECLIKVAKAIHNSISRATDLAARYGGEEFAVILSCTNSNSAYTIAESIRESIKHLQIPHPQSSTGPCLTASLGVATCIPDAIQHPEALIKEADANLYKAKHAGRDRTSVG